MQEVTRMSEVRVYALVSPSGKPVAATVSSSLKEAQFKAFDYLYAKSRPWVSAYWKNWDGFIKARRKRGWIIEVFDLCAPYATIGDEYEYDGLA